MLCQICGHKKPSRGGHVYAWGASHMHTWQKVQQVQRPLQECMTKGKVDGNEIAEAAKGDISWTKYFGILF